MFRILLYAVCFCIVFFALDSLDKWGQRALQEQEKRQAVSCTTDTECHTLNPWIKE